MLQRPGSRLILASGSASRRALLTAAGLEFEVRPAGVDEAAVKRAADRDAIKTALRLADLKAQAIATVAPDAFIIGADQILVCEGVWYDKPANREDAAEQLRALRGRTHVLATAVVCYEHGTQVWCHTDAPHLTMREFSDEFLRTYLDAEGDIVSTTVGGYRIEGIGVHLFSSVEGDHATVLGLPLLPLLAFLREAGHLL
jgi:septum formation protein